MTKLLHPKDDFRHTYKYELKQEFDEAGVTSATLDFEIAVLELGHTLREVFSIENFLNRLRSK